MAISIGWALGCSGEPEPPPQPQAGAEAPDGRIAPLLDGLGSLHREITTADPMAQRFFDQGLALHYGFNHLEAGRSFEEAARIDPTCAMCFWGQALSAGPNINDSVPGAERERKAWEAVRRARELAGGATEVERALIDALATRYADPAADVSLADRNMAWAEAIASVYDRFPDDPDVGVLFASALMNTTPWNYWSPDGSARPGTNDVLDALEKVMASHPDHPGAHHYYIHAVEASSDPDRAVPSADRLGDLVPVAGHLVHMPSHIYIRVGRYADATDANVRAIAADEDYVTQCRAQGIYPVAYYPHNIHFLWSALTMEGRADEALRQARKVAARHTDEQLAAPGFGLGHLLKSLPLFTMVRFGQWDAVLAEPEPPAAQAFTRAVRHYARGMAFRARGELEAAATELEALRAAASDPALTTLRVFDLNALADLARIGVETLEGELAAARGEVDAAVQHLERAIEIEDGLLYSEPRDWPQPPRHSLGAILLEAGRAPDAERVYRRDLEIHRDNGWSLHGLAQSLEAQGRSDEAGAVRERLQTAWARSNVELTSSRF